VEATILIVDENVEMSAIISAKLRSSNYLCDSCPSIFEARSRLEIFKYNIVLVSVELNDGSAIEFMNTVISNYPKTAIMLSANKENITKAAAAIDLGAQDYVLKPYSFTDVIRKIESTLIRVRAQEEDFITCKTQYGDLVIDPRGRQVRLAGKDMKCTLIEFQLLKELVLNKNKVLEYDDLIIKVWGETYLGERSYLHNYINRLRKLLYHRELIVTVPKVGYRLLKSP